MPVLKPLRFLGNARRKINAFYAHAKLRLKKLLGGDRP